MGVCLHDAPQRGRLALEEPALTVGATSSIASARTASLSSASRLRSQSRPTPTSPASSAALTEPKARLKSQPASTAWQTSSSSSSELSSRPQLRPLVTDSLSTVVNPSPDYIQVPSVVRFLVGNRAVEHPPSIASLQRGSGSRKTTGDPRWRADAVASSPEAGARGQSRQEKAATQMNNSGLCGNGLVDPGEECDCGTR
ncbi:unnamed protein product [Protopolystoma xenopodis]|uniref:Uncharacterized protein n=1 Tax=Protopolystoma xenopodis TaxID=117903 RepID=A0A3S5B9P1_9PLAT|nr:unnamed protein product [Protopolystoma xenopodis]